MPNWKKVIVSGSNATLNSLNVTTNVVAQSFTGSLQGTSSWAVSALTASYALTASFSQNAQTASNIQGGATNYIPVFNSPTSLSSSVVYQSGSHIGINITNFTSGDPEALYVFQTHPTSFNVITGKGNSNNYLQLNIQNTNTGVSASSDIVATADNGTETSNYIDIGINGSNFSGPIGDPNDAYLYSAGNHLHIGNITPGQPLQFFVGGDDTNLNRKLQLNDNNQHNMTGSLNVSGSVTAFSFTGSLQGTSSWAENATNASTASYVLNAISASFATTALTASYADNFTVAGTLTAQTIVVQTITSSTDYVTGSTIFGSSLNNTHQFTGSVSITGSLSVNNSNVILTNQTSSMTVLSSSYAISASYAINADFLDGKDSTVFVTTGSNIFIGNQTVTGSLFTSGSNTLIGSTTLTGSLNISGSTTQVGNNTLLGTTTLSGSVIISGSANASANFTLQGHLRLDPGQDPGSNNQTSSYLFTSASNTATGYDLYYRQQNNLIKFKWIEGGLSTGLLYGGGISYSGSTIYVKKGSGIINNMNATTGSEINPILTYVTWNDYTASAQYLTSSQNTYLYVDASGSIFQQTSFFNQTQYEQAIPLGRVTHPNYVSITGYGSNVQTTYDSDTQQNDFIRAFGPIKVSGFSITPQTGSLSFGFGSGIAYNLGGFYTQDPNSPSHYESAGFATASIARAWRSGSGVYLDNNGGAFYNTVDPDYWDDGTGVLNTMNAGDWQIQRVFANPVTGRVVVYYGQTGTYTNLLNALQYLATDPFEEGEFTAKSLVFIGYLVLRGQTNSLTDTVNNRIINAGIFRNIAGGSSGGGAVAQTLNDLSDVLITTPTNYQALVYDGGNWINGTPLNATSASFALNALSASYALTTTSASYALTASYVLNAVSSSYALNATSASYALVATSASYAATTSYADNFTVNDTLTAQTIVAQTVTSSIIYSSGSNIFGSQLTNIQQITGSLRVTGSGNHYIMGGNVGINNLNPSYSLDSTGVINSNAFGTFLGFSNPVGRTFNYITSYGSGNTINYPGTGTAGFQYNYFANNEFYTTAGGTSNLLTVGFRNQNYIRSTVSTVPFQMIALNNLFVANDANDLGTLGQLYSVFTSFNREATASPLGGNTIAYHFNTQTRLRSGFYTTTRWGNETLQVADTAASQASTITDYDFLLNTTNVGSSSGGPGTITNFYLLRHVTNIGATGTITNRWGLYLTDSSFKSYHAGSFLIGSNVSTGEKLQVTGDANITANLTATGSIKFPSLSNTNQPNIVSYDTATGQLYYQTTSSLSVTSASYAATASTANSGFTIGTTQTYTNIVASTVVGSNNVFTHTTGSYTSAFYKYTVSNGANARSGEVIAVWNGSSAQYTDYSTLDIGSTSGVTPSVSVVGSDILFNISTGTSGWRLKSTVTYL